VTGKERQKETVPFFSRHPVHLSRSYFWPTQVKKVTISYHGKQCSPHKYK